MTSRQDTPRHLLIVATCWYADKGSGNDEFCRQWGLDVGKDHAWFDKLHQEVLLLVLHGFKDGDITRDIAEAIRAAAQERPQEGTLAKEAWFCHHSLVGTTTDNDALLETAIEHAKKIIVDSFHVRAVKPVRYRSAGGLAVTQLILALREGGGGTPDSLSEAVEKAAGGRTLFVERLRGIQSGLIRLRLMIEAGWEKDLSKEDMRLLDRAMAACRIPDGGRFGDWIGILENYQAKNSDVAGAISLLRVLGGQSRPREVAGRELSTPRPRANVWGSLNSSARIFLQASRNASVSVREDIALFARAVDILLVAAETLPPAIAMNQKSSASRALDI